MKKIRLITIFLFVTIFMQAQSSSHSIQPLKPGEMVPDIELTFHFPDSVAKPHHLSDFRGKMILFDTWSTGCAPCVAALPHMLRLQEKYGDKLKVIIYTQEREENYKKMWKDFEDKVYARPVLNAATKLPAILGDTILSQLFPTSGPGTKIWIDSAGRYQAITLEALPSETRVEDLRAGRRIVSDKIFIADIRAGAPKKEWVEKRIGFSDHLLNYSILTQYDEKFKGVGAFYSDQFKIDSLTGKVTGITMINASVLELFSMVYFKKGIPDNNFLILSKNLKDGYILLSGIKTYADALAWKQKHLYCYALQTPSNENGDAFSVMKTEMERLFSLKGSIENRKIKCWILKRITSEDKIKSNDKTDEPVSQEIFSDNDEHKIIAKNVSMQEFFGTIQGSKYFVDCSKGGPFACTFIDETNYKGNVDIGIPIGMENYSLPLLRKELQKYGLDLVQGYRVRKVLVLRDINEKK